MALGSEASYENTKSNESSATKSDQTKNSGTSTNYSNQTDATVNTTVTNGSTNTSTRGASSSTVGPSSQTTFNSGSVNTSQLLLTPEAVTHMVNQILEGTSGLAATVGGQKGAGIYNDTSTKLLTDDLLVRTAGEVAAKSAVTRTVIGSSSSTTTNSGFTTNNSAQDFIENIGGTRVDVTQGATQQRGNAQTGSVEDVILVSEGKKEAESTSQGGKVKVGWIVCTELYKQGRMPWRYYVHGSSVFAGYNDAAKRGYYLWAVPALKHLRAHPESKLSSFLDVMLNARAEYLAAEANCKGAKKSLLGFISKNLYWGCVLLGHTVARNYDLSQVPNLVKE